MEVLLALILLPLLGSLLLFFWRKKGAKNVAFLIAMIELLLTIFLLTNFNKSNTNESSLIYEFQYAWLSVINASFHFEVDGLGVLMLGLVNFLIPLIILSSFNEKNEYPSYFYALILLMQFAFMGVFTANDALLFYMFWELALIPIWFIVGLWGQEDKRIKVTRKFFIYTFSGSLLMLLGFVFAYHFSDSFSLTDLAQNQLDEMGKQWVFILIFLGFAVKLPLFPLHTWLPDTHTYAPTQGSMLLSGLMLKMAVYGIMKFLWNIVPMDKFWIEIIVVLAIIGVIYGALIAMLQDNIKTIIAYSSISHLGMITAGIFVSKNGISEGAILQTMAHGVNAVGLFYCADILYKRFKTKEITQMGGLAKVAPKFAVLFFIILLGSMAVPLTNGFVGEFLLLKSIYEYNMYYGITAGLSIIFGAVYLLRLYSKTMLGEGNPEVLEEAKDISGVEFLVLGILALMVIVFGVFPNLILDFLIIHS